MPDYVPADRLLWFFATILPLILTPGPDILLCIAQGISRGASGVRRAVAGITLGYATHAALAAVGVAALVAASPILFEMVRWAGVLYLLWLALGMLRSAWRGLEVEIGHTPPLSLWRGFLTSFLNPKGLLVYLAVLPQFVHPGGSVPAQSLMLSFLFVASCAGIYTAIGLIAARSTRIGSTSRTRVRIVEAVGGTLLGAAALRLSAS